MPTVLIVEDDAALSSGIVLSFKQESFTFLQAYTLKEARQFLRRGGVELILLDVNLPDGSGFDLCREVRLSSQVPIIFLTANDMELDVVTGLSLGGDDYLVKPFSLMVLRARVEAVLRRGAPAKDTGRVEIGPFDFHFDAMTFYKDGTELVLSKTEQRLLRLLVQNRGAVLSREVLVDKVWGSPAEYVDENALSVAVSRLRAKLEDDPAQPEYIRTVYGIGYQWAKKG